MRQPNIDKERERALQILHSGSPKQVVELYLAEHDRKNNGTRGIIEPLITEPADVEELTSKAFSQYQQMSDLYDYHSTVINAVIAKDSYQEQLLKTISSTEGLLQLWGTAEALETAVNVALAEIKDPEQRKRTSHSIASKINLQGCSMGVDYFGFIKLYLRDRSMAAKVQPTMTDSIAGHHRALVKQIAGYKAVMKAIKDYISQHKLVMPATTHTLNYTYQLVASMCNSRHFLKYTDKPQMEPQPIHTRKSKEQPDGNQNKQGDGMLYDKYRVLPVFEDVELDMQRYETFTKNFLKDPHGK